MIEEDVKQTRCTTCDAEHVYKGGKVPKRRKKETPAALYKEVLAGMPDTEAAPVLAPVAADGRRADAASPLDVRRPRGHPNAARPKRRRSPDRTRPPSWRPPGAGPAGGTAPMRSTSTDGCTSSTEVEEGPVHRPLIRAQLPRIEGQKEERRLPEFTIRQATRGGPGHFRGGDSR